MKYAIHARKRAHKARESATTRPVSTCSLAQYDPVSVPEMSAPAGNPSYYEINGVEGGVPYSSSTAAATPATDASALPPIDAAANAQIAHAAQMARVRYHTINQRRHRRKRSKR
eukprot:jgi/Mesvir1/18304/Mv18459-RA.1